MSERLVIVLGCCRMFKPKKKKKKKKPSSNVKSDPMLEITSSSQNGTADARPNCNAFLFCITFCMALD